MILLNRKILPPQGKLIIPLRLTEKKAVQSGSQVPPNTVLTSQVSTFGLPVSWVHAAMKASWKAEESTASPVAGSVVR